MRQSGVWKSRSRSLWLLDFHQCSLLTRVSWYMSDVPQHAHNDLLIYFFAEHLNHFYLFSRLQLKNLHFSIMSMKGHVLNSPGVYVLWPRILFFVQHIPSFVKVSTFTMLPRLPPSNVPYYLLPSMIAKLESSRLPNLYPQVKFVCMSGCAYKIKWQQSLRCKRLYFGSSIFHSCLK